MLLPELEAKKLTDRVLALSQADSCIVSLSGREHGNIRFALNNVTTSGFQDDLTLSITSNFGKRSGTVTLNELAEASIAAAVKKSEAIARLAPEDPEFLAPLGPQKFLESRVYFERTANAKPDKLAALCAPAIREAADRKVTTAGYLRAGAGFGAMATSNGLFVFEKSTEALFTVSARTSDGTGSGWAGQAFHDIARLDTAALGRIAVQKTLESRQPVALEPGKYTVILEPSAVGDLVGLMLGSFDARSADEGRSPFTKKGGGNKVGEKLFGERVNLYSDPQEAIAPGGIYTTDGLPATRRVWVENGVLRNLTWPRYWAQKSGRDPVPFPTNLVMAGGDTPVDEMIRRTKRGVLVTRLWYIRVVDPRTLVLTGLTRDGTFLIENGKLARPVKNFRFNESPIAMLNNIEAMGPGERATGSEVDNWPLRVPPLLVKDFTFSSRSDAV